MSYNNINCSDVTAHTMAEAAAFNNCTKRRSITPMLNSFFVPKYIYFPLPHYPSLTLYTSNQYAQCATEK